MLKPIRYIAINPPVTGPDGQPEVNSASYNASLGEDAHGCNLALYYARQNIAKYGGEIFVQFIESAVYQPLYEYLRALKGKNNKPAKV